MVPRCGHRPWGRRKARRPWPARSPGPRRSPPRRPRRGRRAASERLGSGADRRRSAASRTPKNGTVTDISSCTGVTTVAMVRSAGGTPSATADRGQHTDHQRDRQQPSPGSSPDRTAQINRERRPVATRRIVAAHPDRIPTHSLPAGATTRVGRLVSRQSPAARRSRPPGWVEGQPQSRFRRLTPGGHDGPAATARLAVRAAIPPVGGDLQHLRRRAEGRGLPGRREVRGPEPGHRGHRSEVRGAGTRPAQLEHRGDPRSAVGRLDRPAGRPGGLDLHQSAEASWC